LSPFELNKPDYLLWGCFCSSFASSSTPAGCLLQLKHGLDKAARGAKSQSENCNKQSAVGFITRLPGIVPRSRTCSIDRRYSIDMAFTYSHLLLSMSEVREPPVDCLLPSSRDLTSASFFSNRNNPRTSLGPCNLDPLPGMNLVNALVLVPLLLTSLSVNLQGKFLSSA
jgi:hypothetical protein